jgi:hypothetical protein
MKKNYYKDFLFVLVWIFVISGIASVIFDSIPGAIVSMIMFYYTVNQHDKESDYE